MKMPLSQIAHARSGDKGDVSNVGVIALLPEYYPVLLREVTAERVKAHFGALVKGAVTRYELPNLAALNFVMEQGLDGAERFRYGLTHRARLMAPRFWH